MNRVVLIGNLAQDPELRYTPSGVPVLHFTLAVNRPFTTQEGKRDADFIPVVVWRKRATTCSEYLQKGSQVAVVGRLQVRSYQDKRGIKRKASEVVARRVAFLQRIKRPAPGEKIEEKPEDELDTFSISGEDLDTEGDQEPEE